MSFKIKILPRWLIFLLDLFVAEICIFLSLILRYNFYLNLVVGHGLKYILLITLVINAALFYIFKSYSGVIRYTNIEGTFRLLLVNSAAALFYFIINKVYLAFFAEGSVHPLLPLSVVAINFFITNFVMISYRFFVKYCFKLYWLQQQDERIRKKAAIYSVNETGIHIKKMMNEMPDSDMQIVSFIDDTVGKSGKMIDGVAVYNASEHTFAKLREEGVELLIVENNIKKETLNTLVDICLMHDIRIQQLPPIQEWLNGRLNAQQLRNINIEDLLEREVINIGNQQFNLELKGKKILVTGAAGSIGSELVRQLTNYKPSIIILCDKAESPLHELHLELQEKFKHAIVKPYMGDICDSKRMEHLFEVYNPQIVFHAAAYKHVPLMEEHPSVAVLNNVLGTKILAELSVVNGVEKFVMISTDKAVNPTNIMGASKRIAEIFTQSFYKHLMSLYNNGADKHTHPTKFVTTRFGNVLGSNGSVIPRFKQQLQQGGPITVTHPEITRYFMTIPEACQLVIEAGVMGQGGEIFVFDMGRPVKIVDLARKIIKLAGKEPDIDIKIAFTGLRPGEKLYEELLNDSENTMHTYHEKIMIAKVREYDFHLVESRINKLIASARQHYTLETVGQMKLLVPEFISNNSVFEELDVEKK